MRLDDAVYMSRCLELARKGAYYVAPNPMVGAVLVDRDGRIVSEGWHMRFGGPHAEVHCIRRAEQITVSGERLAVSGKTINWGEMTLYVSLEPCSHWGKTPPCADLIVEKGIGRVVVGMQDPNPLVSGQGIARLREHGIEVVVGVLEAECRELNKRFLCLQEKKRPYVILKWAQTADGYLDGSRLSALGSRMEGPLVISNAVTKQIVHKMRAENMAILVGSGTALKDNPRLLTTRWSGRNPIRVLLDRRGRVPKDSRIFSDEAETLVMREEQNWQEILQSLAKRNIHSVLVEGGAEVLNHILEDGTWDEIHVEVSPVRLHREGVKAPLIALPSEAAMEVEGHRLFLIDN